MKKKIIILIPIIVILGYVLYKSCLLLYFRDLNAYSTDYNNVTINEKNVKVDKSLANTKIDNLNIYIPDELIEDLSRPEYYRYVPKNETSKYHTTYLTIAKGLSFYEYLYDEDKRIQTIGYEKLMKKNNMKSESDLIKYYFTHGKKSNIFTSSNDIKLRYLSDVCVKNSSIYGEEKDRNYYFSGDLDGTLNLGNKRSYSIRVYNEKKNEYYGINITKSMKKKEYIDIITDEVFDKILHSIYFD